VTAEPVRRKGQAKKPVGREKGAKKRKETIGEGSGDNIVNSVVWSAVV
jgi:hypothetical protein